MKQSHSSPAQAGIEWDCFSTLNKPGLKHGFSRRLTGVMELPDKILKASLPAIGVRPSQAVFAQQIHGAGVACINEIPDKPVPGVDALITSQTQIALVIQVADCGPVYFYDPRQRAIGLAHSGRRGTEVNVAGATIRAMHKHLGSDPANLVVFLGPCIRPPHYEVDFAAEIGRQVQREGVQDYTDSKICTASNLDAYYSYRAEKGHTGRMWAVLMLE